MVFFLQTTVRFTRLQALSASARAGYRPRDIGWALGVVRQQARNRSVSLQGTRAASEERFGARPWPTVEALQQVDVPATGTDKLSCLALPTLEIPLLRASKQKAGNLRQTLAEVLRLLECELLHGSIYCG